MASNLFHLNHNFLTRKWPSLSTKSHFLKHTEIYVSSEMIAYAPQDIFQTLPVLVRLGICKKEILIRFLPVFLLNLARRKFLQECTLAFIPDRVIQATGLPAGKFVHGSVVRCTKLIWGVKFVHDLESILHFYKEKGISGN